MISRPRSVVWAAEAGAALGRAPEIFLICLEPAPRQEPRTIHDRREETMSDDREARIRQRAYELWEAEGQPAGRDQDYWLRAEAEIADDKPAPAAKAPRARKAKAEPAAGDEATPKAPRARRTKAEAAGGEAGEGTSGEDKAAKGEKKPAAPKPRRKASEKTS
ncbi:DUF2934 domain-containing protein [Cereibacter sphaeroides]|nr:DUF2934 domain-containing protein [Cereibacter sphaeroides]